MVVAVFGTTISPYLFFWQAAQEMEDTTERPPQSAREVRRHLRRIKIDTFIGMSFSNLIAFFIILSTAATLHAAGVKDIQTSAQAAALRDEGCDLMQGFHFAHPLAAADFARRLAAPGAHTAPAAAGPHPTDADAP